MIRFFAFSLVVLLAALPVRAEIKIQEITSPGGIKAWFVNEPSIPIISMKIAFKGGASLDAEDKLGATYLMSGLLEEGAGELDSTGFRQETERLAASFGFDASRDSVSVTAEFLSEVKDEAIDLLRLAIVEPNFDDIAFERTKGQVMSSIKRRATDPNDIASDAFQSLAFSGHPYALPYQGTAETMMALTQEDMRTAHKNGMTKDNVYVGVVGDISEEELGKMLDRLLGDLPDVGPKPLPDITFQAKGGTTVIDFNTPQSVAMWGHQGIERTDPDFFAAFVMNRILGGGGFTSRLTEEVREKRGLTYGVYSYLAEFEHAQFVGGSVSSANDRIGEAIEIVKKEWARMAKNGVTDEELEAAKKFMTGSYPLRFDGNSQIANILTFSQTDGLPIDYPLNRNSYIEAVTKEDISRVAKRLLRVEDMRFVIVGKPNGVVSSD